MPPSCRFRWRSSSGRGICQKLRRPFAWAPSHFLPHCAPVFSLSHQIYTTCAPGRSFLCLFCLCRAWRAIAATERRWKCSDDAVRNHRTPTWILEREEKRFRRHLCCCSQVHCPQRVTWKTGQPRQQVGEWLLIPVWCFYSKPLGCLEVFRVRRLCQQSFHQTVAQWQ